MKRILGLLGWLGVVLVLAARRHPVHEAGAGSTGRSGLALAGLVVTALYALSQWRDIGRSFQGRNVQYGSIAARQRAAVPRDPRRRSTGSRSAAEQALGPHRAASSSRCPIRRRRSWRTSRSRSRSRSSTTGSRPASELPRPARASTTYLSKQVSVEYIDAIKRPGRRRRSTSITARADDRASSTTAGPSARRRPTSRASPTR